MSRPSSSSPNQWLTDGPSSRCASSWAAGSKGVSDGPISAATTAARTMAAPSLLIPDARVDETVEEVRHEVHADVGHGYQQDASLHQRVVPEANRLNQQAPDTGPREDRLGNHRACEHRAE